MRKKPERRKPRNKWVVIIELPETKKVKRRLLCEELTLPIDDDLAGGLRYAREFHKRGAPMRARIEKRSQEEIDNMPEAE